jgi:hypothetical protein
MIFSFQYKEEDRVDKLDELLLQDVCKQNSKKIGSEVVGHGKHDTSNQGGMYQRNGISSGRKKYDLPRSTLYDYVRSNRDPFQATKSKLVRKPIIPPALEENLVEYLLLSRAEASPLCT